MKQYNCPDCKVKADSCENCQRYCENVAPKTNQTSDTQQAYDTLFEQLRKYNTTTSASYVPPACRYCSNHPSNGGSGICNCILGGQSYNVYRK